MMPEPAMRELPAPGWYRDPASGRKRWWNGIAWTPYLDGQRVDVGSVKSAVIQPVLASGTSVETWAIWLIVIALPLLAAVPVVLTDYRTYFQDVLIAAQAHTVAPAPASLLIGQVLGLLTFGASLLLAFVDWRLLRQRGIVRPFHWLWDLLPLVYLIGRGVVLRRRVGRGMSPLVVSLVLSLCIGIGEGSVMVTAMLDVFAGQVGA